MTLRELQQQANNGDWFTAVTAKGQEYRCRWTDVQRGQFELGDKQHTCNVAGAPHATVKNWSRNIREGDKSDDGRHPTGPSDCC